MKITFTMSQEDVDAIVKAHKSALSGEDSDEYAGNLAVSEFFNNRSLDMETEVLCQICDRYDLEYFKA